MTAEVPGKPPRETYSVYRSVASMTANDVVWWGLISLTAGLTFGMLLVILMVRFVS